MLRFTMLALCVFTASGCSHFSEKKFSLEETMNPTKIHGASDEKNLSKTAEKIPVDDYFNALKLAQPIYQEKSNQLPENNQKAIENYVAEGIGLVDTYCSRWFRKIDDMSRLLAYQNENMNVITQLGTTLLGIGSANANFITGYGAATAAIAGMSNNANSSFFATPTATKVRRHIDTLMQKEATDLKLLAKNPDFKFKEAYTRLERYADLCTHARAKEIVESALDATKTEVTNGVMRSITLPTK